MPSALADNPDLKKEDTSTAWDTTTQEGGQIKDIFGRRTWDKKFYADKAKAREEEGSDEENAVSIIPADQRTHLVRRNANLCLDAKVNTRTVETAATLDSARVPCIAINSSVAMQCVA